MPPRRSVHRKMTFAAALLCAGIAGAQDKRPVAPPPAKKTPAPVSRPGARQSPTASASPASPLRTLFPGSARHTPQPVTPPNPPATTVRTTMPAANSYGPRSNTLRTGPQPVTGAPAGVVRPNPGTPGYAAATRPASRPPVTSTPLNPTSSTAAVSRMNANRSSMTGINHRPLPSGAVTQRSDGASSIAASGGRQYNVRPNGTLASVSMPGQTASYHPDGRLAALHTQNLDVIQGSRGARTVVLQRPDRSVVVSTGPHSGYVQRQVVFGGHPYFQRTVLVGGVQYQRVYAGYAFHGVTLQSYVPLYRYPAAFYGYVYYPWGPPVSYAWGWTTAPWYAAYSGYFAPAPAYAAPYDWLADYSLSQTLANAYAAGEAAGATQQAGQDSLGDPGSQTYSGQYGAAPAPNGSQSFADPNTAPADAELAAPTDTPITQEIRQTLAQQVQQQVAFENAASTAAQPEDASKLTDLPQVLLTNHIFVVNSTLNAATPQEMTCNLSAGDTLQLAESPAADATAADVVVASSRRSDCPVGVHVALTLEVLSEMQNTFRANLDDGLAALHNQQGKGGLPPAPPSVIAAPPRPVEYPPSNAENVAKAIAAANQQGTQAETSMTQNVFNAVSQNQ